MVHLSTVLFFPEPYSQALLSLNRATNSPPLWVEFERERTCAREESPTSVYGGGVCLCFLLCLSLSCTYLHVAQGLLFLFLFHFFMCDERVFIILSHDVITSFTVLCSDVTLPFFLFSPVVVSFFIIYIYICSLCASLSLPSTTFFLEYTHLSCLCLSRIFLAINWRPAVCTTHNTGYPVDLFPPPSYLLGGTTARSKYHRSATAETNRDAPKTAVPSCFFSFVVSLVHD